MKTTLLSIALSVFLTSLFVGGGVYALATYKSAELSDFTVLQNNSTDLDNVKVSKFNDGMNTCYLLTSKGDANGRMIEPTSVSISCISNKK